MKPRSSIRVHCVGHSLGGALATLNADYLARRGCAVNRDTFGAPRVGLRSFADNLTRKLGAENIYRVAHTSDVVTMVPSCATARGVADAL